MKREEAHITAFAERLNQALDHNGIPPRNHGRIQYVSEMFLLTHPGAGKWVNGAVLPSKHRRREIAQRLGVNYDWLEFGKGEMLAPAQPVNSGLRQFPVLSFHEAVQFERLLTPDFIGKTLPLDINVGPRAFVVYNEGSAMAGRFPEGCILIFDPDVPVKDGDYVLAKTHKLPEAIFRQYMLGNAGRYLYAHDPRYQSYKLTPDDTIVARLMQHRANH